MADRTIAFHIDQVESEIKEIFIDLIDMSDYENKKQNDKKNAFNSRALAAYSLHILADVSANIAAESIVDGVDDNGIDGFLFNPKQKTLWIVQAKWTQNGQSCPSKGDLLKFKEGIFDLLDFSPKKAKKFNYKVKVKEKEIKQATTTPGLKIKVVIAYTGDKLSTHARNTLEECIEELNDNHDDIAFLEIFDLDKAYNTVIQSSKQEDIEVQFSLSNWGKVDEPYQAFYGQINASEIGKWWVNHKNKLFSKNIRDFLGGSEVNSEISKTIESEPELFWYFNNGITVLCKNITKLSIKKDRIQSDFIAKGISIVNGAQTIGSIGAIYEDASDENKEMLESAEVFIRFISLDKCESESFGLKVTKATNTQNRVEVRDFVALDSQQERLRQEFQRLGRNYHYKRSASTFIPDTNNYGLEEATVTLACASNDIDLVILVKQDISKLWSDTSQAPYTNLFNHKADALQIMRQIEIKREVENINEILQTELESKIKLDVLKHGNLFLLHLAFKQVKNEIYSISYSEEDFQNYKSICLPEIINKTLDLSEEFIHGSGNKSRLWGLFSSSRKSNELKGFIMQK
jgi:hypothetical protein